MLKSVKFSLRIISGFENNLTMQTELYLSFNDLFVIYDNGIALKGLIPIKI